MFNELSKKLDLDKIIAKAKRYTLTEVGAKYLINEKPAEDEATAELKINYTYELKILLEEYGELNLVFIDNLTDSIHKSKLEGYTLSPKEIISIGKLLLNSRLIKQTIQHHKLRFPNLYRLIENLYVDKFLERRISETFDDYGEVKDSASPELKRIKEEYKTLQLQIQKLYEKILKRLSLDGLVQDELITLRDGRMVIPVRSEFKRMVKGFIHAESASGQTTYIEPAETLELNNELVSLQFEEKREVNRILSLITQEIGKVADLLLNNLEIISVFDATYAKAKYAIEIRGNKISFSENREFELLDCRHPLLIHTIGYHKTVPFNLRLDPNISGIIISGPNAGGKTVFMKSIGIFSILSKMGYLLPSHPDSKMPFFNNVFIDIGDEQSIDNDISTFGSHIKNIGEIFDKCDSKSLVLLDELGTGTDPTQGAALAISIIENLIKKKCFLVATTHHSSLKIYAANHEKLINASMEFDAETLAPTYKFICGIPGSSYAFEIARRMNLHDFIIQDAKKNLSEDNLRIENYLLQLHDKIQHYSKLVSELKKEREEIKLQKEDLTSKLNQIKSEAKSIKKKALLEAEEIVKTANRLIENSIKEIKESNAKKEKIKLVKEKIQTESKKLNDLIRTVDEIYKDASDDLKDGDYVQLDGQQTIGKIISIDRKKNQAFVQVDNFKVNIVLDKLSKVNSPSKNIQTISKHSIETKYIPLRLDIRGMRAIEAEDEIIKYIDKAVMYGLFNIEILHGKGDGILKNVTHRVLQNHPFVEYFNFAPVDQGGEGITIAKLKD